MPDSPSLVPQLAAADAALCRQLAGAVEAVRGVAAGPADALLRQLVCEAALASGRIASARQAVAGVLAGVFSQLSGLAAELGAGLGANAALDAAPPAEEEPAVLSMPAPAPRLASVEPEEESPEPAEQAPPPSPVPHAPAALAPDAPGGAGPEEVLRRELLHALCWPGLHAANDLAARWRHASDRELLAEIGRQWEAGFSVQPRDPGWRGHKVRGGKAPAFWLGASASQQSRPTLAGKALAQAAREALGLGRSAGGGTSTPETAAAAPQKE